MRQQREMPDPGDVSRETVRGDALRHQARGDAGRPCPALLRLPIGVHVPEGFVAVTDQMTAPRFTGIIRERRHIIGFGVRTPGDPCAGHHDQAGRAPILRVPCPRIGPEGTSAVFLGSG